MGKKHVISEELQALLADLPRQVAELTASNASLSSEIAELKRSTKRQAAPFSKGTEAPCSEEDQLRNRQKEAQRVKNRSQSFLGICRSCRDLFVHCFFALVVL
jgi:hypothetical protein